MVLKAVDMAIYPFDRVLKVVAMVNGVLLWSYSLLL